jgi:capsid protein
MKKKVLNTQKPQKALYDASESSKMRRKAKIEYTNEEGILPVWKKLGAIAVGRDLERNFSPARGIINQFKVNVVGSLGKLQLNLEGGKEAEKYFNSVWAKDCDARDENHFSTILQNIVASVIREGDCGILVDDGIIDNDGKLWLYEADQIGNIKDSQFKAKFGDKYNQDSGIIREKNGKITGYIFSGTRGLTEYDINEVTIFKRGTAKLVKNPWRLNQGRGIGSILTSATQVSDLYEILQAELASAKRAAMIAGFTKRTPTNEDPDDYAEAETIEGEEVTTTTTTELDTYDRFEALSGGYWEYLQEGDDVQVLDLKGRPNSGLTDFVNAVLAMSGASMGLAKVYTTLQASTSYTAFRGEMLISWATFSMLQKWLERSVCDWVAVKVLKWAEKNGKIGTLPEGWETAISWQWPAMPEVNIVEIETAIEKALKNGSTDYSKILGPDWKAKLESYAEQLNVIRGLNLPLSIFSTVSGAPVEVPDGNELEENTEKEE